MRLLCIHSGCFEYVYLIWSPIDWHLCTQVRSLRHGRFWPRHNIVVNVSTTFIEASWGLTASLSRLTDRPSSSSHDLSGTTKLFVFGALWESLPDVFIYHCITGVTSTWVSVSAGSGKESEWCRFGPSVLPECLSLWFPSSKSAVERFLQLYMIILMTLACLLLFISPSALALLSLPLFVLALPLLSLPSLSLCLPGVQILLCIAICVGRTTQACSP